jgi:hypothetical protein
LVSHSFTKRSFRELTKNPVRNRVPNGASRVRDLLMALRKRQAETYHRVIAEQSLIWLVRTGRTSLRLEKMRLRLLLTSVSLRICATGCANNRSNQHDRDTGNPWSVTGRRSLQPTADFASESDRSDAEDRIIQQGNRPRPWVIGRHHQGSPSSHLQNRRFQPHSIGRPGHLRPNRLLLQNIKPVIFATSH